MAVGTSTIACSAPSWSSGPAEDPTGRRIGEYELPRRRALLSEYRKTLAARVPGYTPEKGLVAREHMTVAKLVLPLASDGKAVDMLMVSLYSLSEFERL